MVKPFSRRRARILAQKKENAEFAQPVSGWQQIALATFLPIGLGVLALLALALKGHAAMIDNHLVVVFGIAFAMASLVAGLMIFSVVRELIARRIRHAKQMRNTLRPRAKPFRSLEVGVDKIGSGVDYQRLKRTPWHERPKLKQK